MRVTSLICNLKWGVLLGGMFLAMATPHAQGAELVLREKFIPTGSVIHLGDIADIHAADGTEARRLATLPLWAAPAEGEQRIASVSTIRDTVRLRGLDPANLRFSGAGRVAIGSVSPTPASEPSATGVTTGFRAGRSTLVDKPEVNTVAPLLGAEREALLALVHEQMLLYLEEKRGYAGNLDVEIRLSPVQLEQLAGRTGEFTIAGGRAPWTGRQLLAMEIATQHGLQKLACTADVLDTTPRVIVRRAIARGQTITAADVALEAPTRETRLPHGKTTIEQVGEAVGREASRALRPGEVVTSDLCLAPLMIQRNQVVSVTLAGGGIELSRQAKALSEARLGEFTEVELLGSKQRLAARVVGPGRLAMADTGPTVEHRETAQREKRYSPY